MLMKVHSYCAVNGYSSDLQLTYNKFLSKLRGLLASEPSLGDWDDAVKLAKSRREEGLRAREKANRILDLVYSSPEGTPSRTPSYESSSLALTGSIDDKLQDGRKSSSSIGLRQRLHALQTGPEVTQLPQNTPAPPTSAIEDEFDERRHILCHHPDHRVQNLAQVLTELDIELTAPGGQGNKGPVRWPANVTLWNFMDYQLIPSLVYEMQYPRTATWDSYPFHLVSCDWFKLVYRLRPLYVLEKTVATFGTFTLRGSSYKIRTSEPSNSYHDSIYIHGTLYHSAGADCRSAAFPHHHWPYSPVYGAYDSLRFTRPMNTDSACAWVQLCYLLLFYIIFGGRRRHPGVLELC